MESDARIIKTKTKLLSAFKSLLEEKEFEKITVNELCEKADVKRATFYKHYTDKYDFLAFFIRSLRNDFDKRAWNRNAYTTSEYYSEYVKAIIGFITENECIITNALNSNLMPAILDIIKEQNFIATVERLNKSISHGMRLPASVEITASMMTGAVSNVLVNWFKKGKPISPEQLTKEISSVIRTIQSGNL